MGRTGAVDESAICCCCHGIGSEQLLELRRGAGKAKYTTGRRQLYVVKDGWSSSSTRAAKNGSGRTSVLPLEREKWVGWRRRNDGNGYPQQKKGEDAAAAAPKLSSSLYTDDDRGREFTLDVADLKSVVSEALRWHSTRRIAIIPGRETAS